MKYWLYRFTAWLIRLLPRKAAYWIGLRICDFAYCMNHRGRGAVRENMRIIFEHQGIHPSQHILDGYTRKTFQYFGKYLADFIRFRAVWPRTFANRSAFGAWSIWKPSETPRAVPFY